MNNIRIITCSDEHKDMFEYFIINKNTILVEKIDEKVGWWFDLIAEITNLITNEKIYISIGSNKSFYYKMVILAFDLYPKDEEYLDDENVPCDNLILKNGKIFDSTLVKEEDIHLDPEDIVITMSSIIYTSSNYIHGSNTRSYFSSEERYNQTLYGLKRFIYFIPKCKIILLEQSLDISDEKTHELLKYCDYIISYKNDSENNYYSNMQPHNKGLGEIYVTLHFCELIKNKKFNIFCKVVGRYTPTSNFNFNDFLSGVPTIKAIPGYGRLGIICYTNFFTIPHKYFKAYLEHHKLWLSMDRKEVVENILTYFIESLPYIKILPTIHIRGRNGMTGKYCYL